MNGNALYDTSILVYVYDTSDGTKHRAAEALVSKVFKGEESGTVSNQILAELFNALTQRIEMPISQSDAELVIRDFTMSDRWTKINYNHKTVGRAIQASIAEKMHFWDSLIAETMRENGIGTIITENVKDFSRSSSISVINPFKE